MSLPIVSNQKLPPMALVQMGIIFGVPLFLLLIPVGDFYTREIRLFFAITLCLLLWAAFEITNLLIPSLLWPAALVITGVAPMPVAYGSWISLIVPTVMAAIVLSNALEEIGLLNRISYWIINKCGGSFNRTMYALFFAGLAVSIATFACGSVVIATLCYGVCRAMKAERSKEAAIIMMVGMLAGSTIKMFVYYPLFMGAMMGSTATVDPSFSITIFDLIKYNWPVLIYCLIFIALMLFLGKTKNSSVGDSATYFAEQYAKLGKMSRKEKIGCLVISAIMFFILTNPLHKLDPMYAFIFALGIIYLPGISIGSDKNVRDVPWGTVVFVASCMGIGAVCGHLGLTSVIAVSAKSLLADMSSTTILFGTLGFGIIANLVMTPLAMLAGFSGTILQICLNIGIDPKLVLSAFYASTDMVFLPYEYVTFLIFFSFGTMTTGQFLKYHALKNILYIVFFGLINIPYWMLMGFL